MVPNAAVTAEVPELVSARPLASLWITKLKELATVIETAIVADALADAEAGLTSATRTKRIDTGKAIFFHDGLLHDDFSRQQKAGGTLRPLLCGIGRRGDQL